MIIRVENWVIRIVKNAKLDLVYQKAYGCAVNYQKNHVVINITFVHDKGLLCNKEH
jgi:hypothetical protein